MRRHLQILALAALVLAATGCPRPAAKALVVKVFDEAGNPVEAVKVDALETKKAGPNWAIGVKVCTAERTVLASSTTGADGRASSEPPLERVNGVLAAPSTSGWPAVFRSVAAPTDGSPLKLVVGPERRLLLRVGWTFNESCPGTPTVVLLREGEGALPSTCKLQGPHPVAEDGKLELSGLGPAPYLLRAAFCGKSVDVTVDGANLPKQLSVEVPEASQGS